MSGSDYERQTRYCPTSKTSGTITLRYTPLEPMPPKKVDTTGSDQVRTDRP